MSVGVTQLPVPCRNCNSFAIKGAGTAPFNPLTPLVAPVKVSIVISGVAPPVDCIGKVPETAVTVPLGTVAHVPSPFKYLTLSVIPGAGTAPFVPAVTPSAPPKAAKDTVTVLGTALTAAILNPSVDVPIKFITSPSPIVTAVPPSPCISNPA